jgi:hypothetical protein
MDCRVLFRFSGGVVAEGVMDCSGEVEKLLKNSPFTSIVELWGEEIYFKLPVKLGLPGERRKMSVGEIAYWPEGNCLCIFFGRTPHSRDGEPVAYSDVKPLGRITSGLEDLKRVKAGESVNVSISRQHTT